MNIAAPYTAICPTLDSEVLIALARTRKPMTGREIARLTGRKAHAGVQDVLTRLVEQGLVDRQEAGRAWLFSLNREHIAAPAVDVLASMRAELLQRIRATVEVWEIKPLAASLFGSFARAEGDTQSDIDLFLVRPQDVADEDARWRAQLNDLADHIERWTGNQASIAEVSERELDQLRTGGPPIVSELRRDALFIYGAEINDLLGMA